MVLFPSGRLVRSRRALIEPSVDGTVPRTPVAAVGHPIRRFVRARATDFLDITLAVPLLTATGLAHASDVAKEKRWSDPIIDTRIEGDAAWLKADGHESLAI